jgi:hypothetical protein
VTGGRPHPFDFAAPSEADVVETSGWAAPGEGTPRAATLDAAAVAATPGALPRFTRVAENPFAPSAMS